MPTETELRDALRSAGHPSASLNTAQVVRGVQRRRLSRQLATGTVATLAVIGIGFVGVQGVRSIAPTSGGTASSADTSESATDGITDDSGTGSTDGDSEPGTGISAPAGGASGGTDGGAIQAAPAEKLNLCGGSLAEVAPSQTGLVLTPVFPSAAPVGTAPVSGSVRLTNTGDTRVTGTTAGSPAMTLSDAGDVVWHSNGPSVAIVMTVDLLPGQSLEYPATFTPVVCSIADDSAVSFSDGLPAAAAGGYQLSAAILFTPERPTPGPADPSSGTSESSSDGGPGDAATSAGELVTGELVPITLG